MPGRKAFMLIFIIAAFLTIWIVEPSFFRNSFPTVSGVETTQEIGVYWNENCSVRVYSINWGKLSLGEVKNVIVYVRNEASEKRFLTMTTENWNPYKAYNYMICSWSYKDYVMRVGEVVRATLSLLVSPQTEGVSNFSFNIVFDAKDHFLGDINRDGVVDGRDLAIFLRAYGSSPQDPTWNPDADLNEDYVIDSRDYLILMRDFGKTW